MLAGLTWALGAQNVSFVLTQTPTRLAGRIKTVLWALLALCVAAFVYIVLRDAAAPAYLLLVIPLSLAVVLFLADGLPGWAAFDHSPAAGAELAGLSAPLLPQVSASPAHARALA